MFSGDPVRKGISPYFHLVTLQKYYPCMVYEPISAAAGDLHFCHENDAKKHLLSRDCWCEPGYRELLPGVNALTGETPVAGIGARHVVIHRRVLPPGPDDVDPFEPENWPDDHEFDEE